MSPIVTNIYMEYYKERAIREAPRPPDIWLRYVDDTFTMLQESEVEYSTHHLNSMDENIKFTVEPEQDNTLAFLDTCICLKYDGSTKVKIYWKATQTSILTGILITIYTTNHHAVVRTPLQRAENLKQKRRTRTYRGGSYKKSAENKRLQNLDV